MGLIKDLLGIKSKNDTGSFILPVKSINDIIESDDGRFRMVCKVSPINGELLSHDDIELVCEAIQAALNAFYGRIGIYIQSEKIDIESNLAYIDRRKQELSSEICLMLLEEQKKHLASMSNKSRNVLNFYIVLEVNEKSYIAAEQILHDNFLSMKNELEAQEIYLQQLKEHDIKAMLYERMNPESSQDEPYQESWELHNILPANARIFSDGRHVEIENRIYRHFSISHYPKTVDQYRWLRKLFTIRGDINIAIILNPKNKSTIQKELSKAEQEAGRKAIEYSKDVSLMKKYESERQSAIDMIEKLGSDNINLYDTNITIGISATNMNELDTLTNLLRSKISAMYCQSTELKYKGYDPYLTTLPILADNKITRNYVWNLTTEDIAAIIPFDSSELMENRGVLIGENVISNGIVIIDQFSKKYNNPHMSIVADTGSGKTFFLSCDAIRHIPYVNYVIMFDVKGDLNFPWASKHKFSPSSGVVTNPFHIRNAIIDSDDIMENGSANVGSYLATKIMDCIVFFKWILNDMTPFEEALLEEDIRDTYSLVGLTFSSKELPDTFPTLSDLARTMQAKINDQDLTDKSREARANMLASLNPYINGAYSKMFNGQTNWDYSFHTVFGLNMLPEAVQKPLYDLLLKDSWQFCKKDGTINPTKKRVYVDEAHAFADKNNPQTLKFISSNMSKQGRGFGVSLVTATQNLPDFLAIPQYGQAILDNAFFKLFFRLGETDLPVAKKLYNFSEAEMRILRGAGTKGKGSRGRGIFIAGSHRVVIQARASRFELEVIDPRQYKELYGVESRYYKHV